MEEAVAEAERQLQPLINVAKSESVVKLRKLLVHQLNESLFYWNRGPRLLTSAEHWRLYETLAKNPKLPEVRDKLRKSKRGPRDVVYDDRQRPFSGVCYPTKQVRQAEHNVINLAKAARFWCYQTDDVDKFKFMATEPLFDDEMQMTVTEMFFDMPRHATGQIAQWWWDLHQLDDGSYPWGNLPNQTSGSHTIPCDPRHWCVLQMKGCIQVYHISDWDGYDHVLGLSREKFLMQQRRDNPGRLSPPPSIFQMPPYEETGSDVPFAQTLYELGVDQIIEDELVAPPFRAIERGQNTNFANGNSGKKWNNQPNKCGRKCLQWLLPSFGFWFALGLPKDLLTREDRMVYHWWMIKRLFKRTLFQVQCEKMKLLVDTYLLAPPMPLSNGEMGQGGAYFYEQAMNSTTAQAQMRGVDQGSGYFLCQRH